MIIGIDGGLGSGKTLLMTRYLYDDMQNGYEIRANYHLNFNHKQLDIKEMLTKNPDLNNIAIGIDEMTVFVDCRQSMSKMNRLISYFILQSRKRNVNLYYTTQDFSMVDVRLIRHTHIQISCFKVYYENGEEIENVRKFIVLDVRNPKNVKINTFYLDISKYYGLYDTNEIILPPI